MRKVMFYSYKGGCGRTTGAANVAAALAKVGKRVLCLDLDIEGPGLHVLSHHYDTEEFHIQQYLREPEPNESEMEVEEVESHVVDVLGNFKDNTDIPAATRQVLARLEFEGTLGCMHLLPATQHVNYVAARGTYLEKKLSRLCEYFNDSYDFMIIDSSSGIGNMSALGMTIADLVLVFFLWSRQSFAGTLHMCRFLNSLKGTRQARPYWLISSTVPSLPEDVQSSVRYRERMESLKTQLLNQVEGDEGFRFLSISERIDLRWEERVVVFDDTAAITDYENIARELISTTVGNGAT